MAHILVRLEVIVVKVCETLKCKDAMRAKLFISTLSGR